jgi:hypothetical protein
VALNAGDKGILVKGSCGNILFRASTPVASKNAVIINGKAVRATVPVAGCKCLAYPDGKGSYILIRAGGGISDCGDRSAASGTGPIFIVDMYQYDTYNRVDLYSEAGVLEEYFEPDSGVEDNQCIMTYPNFMCRDNSGDIYITENNKNCVKKFSRYGDFIRNIGDSVGELTETWDVCSDGDNIYVTHDDDNYTVRKYTGDGEFLLTWGSEGTGDGEFGFYYLVVDYYNGYIFVGDPGNFRIQVFDTSGNFVSKFGSEKTTPAPSNWSSATTYNVDDIVKHSIGGYDERFKCIQGCTNQEPTIDPTDAYWQHLQLFDLISKVTVMDDKLLIKEDKIPGGIAYIQVYDISDVENPFFVRKISEDRGYFMWAGNGRIYAVDDETNVIHVYDIEGDLLDTWTGETLDVYHTVGWRGGCYNPE